MEKRLHQLNYELFKEVYSDESQAAQALKDSKRVYSMIRSSMNNLNYRLDA